MFLYVRQIVYSVQPFCQIIYSKARHSHLPEWQTILSINLEARDFMDFLNQTLRNLQITDFLEVNIYAGVDTFSL